MFFVSKDQAQSCPWRGRPKYTITLVCFGATDKRFARGQKPYSRLVENRRGIPEKQGLKLVQRFDELTARMDTIDLRHKEHDRRGFKNGMRSPSKRKNISDVNAKQETCLVSRRVPKGRTHIARSPGDNDGGSSPHEPTFRDPPRGENLSIKSVLQSAGVKDGETSVNQEEVASTPNTQQGRSNSSQAAAVNATTNDKCGAVRNQFVLQTRRQTPLQMEMSSLIWMESRWPQKKSKAKGRLSPDGLKTLSR